MTSSGYLKDSKRVILCYGSIALQGYILSRAVCPQCSGFMLDRLYTGCVPIPGIVCVKAA